MWQGTNAFLQSHYSELGFEAGKKKQESMVSLSSSLG